MKVSLLQIWTAKSSLEKILGADLPVKIAFRLGRMAKTIDDVLKDIDAQRNKLVRKYGAPIGKGDTVEVKPENIAIFQQEFGELLKETIDLDIKPISLDWLKDIKLSATDFMALGDLVEEPADNPE